MEKCLLKIVSGLGLGFEVDGPMGVNMKNSR